MALYRLEAKIIGRKAKDKAGKVIPGKQVSIVCKAAYRSGEKLRDDRLEKSFDYKARSQEVVHSEIMAPVDAPDWIADRGRLWNAIEKAEKRSDSQLAREFIIALPVELNEEQQVEAVRSWCQVEVVDKGFVADFALHKSKDGNNPHAHILTTLRPVDPDAETGFGKKPDTSGKFNGRGDVGRGAKTDLEAWRDSWEKHCNDALEDAGEAARVDHRSLEARGIDRAPEPKIGVDATAMKRRGKEADPERVRLARWVKMDNYIRPKQREIEQTGEVRQYGIGDHWWERAKVAMEHMRDHAGYLLKDDSSGGGGRSPAEWQAYVSSRKQNTDRGPELDPGR